ncbi:LacI family DNA-binding transcriptional regulator [Amaricoccus sp.]|uniref:LacI family DNA-binding transcriptional regulator n=1 Tax=Amaricoccus sp. TaxID=1872485 RepID=UPI001B4232D8|nr:LacI family DNA-binding transcriptional regulator [Amaricoccus sp.]MBP7243580.1 LacI family DNA-binding transcriptional regulator [Amaricoccus sp.]
MGIRTLARELSLSIGTVSRALNGRPDVNEVTRARVKAAAIAAGYEPNQSGRSLRKGCTGMVAALLPTSVIGPTLDSIFGRVFEGVRRTLYRENVDLMVMFRGPDEDPLTNLQRVVSRRIADAIILTQTRPLDPRIDCLDAMGMRFVAFGRTSDSTAHPWVDFDFEAAASSAAQVFANGGHRRVALVTNALDLNYNDILRRVFRAEAERLGVAAVVLEARDYRLTEESRDALDDADNAPTAFLIGNEGMAAGLYGALAAVGRPVGRGSAVICALPALSPAALVPALSSFDSDLDAVGCALGRHLLAILPGVEPRRAPPATAMPGRLVLRGSEAAGALVRA